MKIYIIIFFCTIGFSSCTSLDVLGYKSLGNHYFLWEEDHHIYSVIWSQNENSAASGGVSIIENVSEYSYNDKYITIKTDPKSDHKARFWLIDKRSAINFSKKNWEQEILSGPLDSIGFTELLSRKKIDPKLILTKTISN